MGIRLLRHAQLSCLPLIPYVHVPAIPHQHSFQRIGSLIHYLVFAPMDIAVVSVCGFRQTGPSFLIGVVVLLLLIPTQALMAHALQRVGKRASVLTGELSCLACRGWLKIQNANVLSTMLTHNSPSHRQTSASA